MFILGGLDIIGNFIPFDPYFIIFGFIALFSMAYSFYGIKQPVIFGEVFIPEQNNDKKGSEKYSRSGLKDLQAEKYLKKLLDFMDSKKPYLDNDLTIQDLSEKTSISRHHITQVLNENYNRNFFTFINESKIQQLYNPGNCL